VEKEVPRAIGEEGCPREGTSAPPLEKKEPRAIGELPSPLPSPFPLCLGFFLISGDPSHQHELLDALWLGFFLVSG
jgi:hypothetical protein